MATKYFIIIFSCFLFSSLWGQGIPNEIPQEKVPGLEKAVEKAQESPEKKINQAETNKKVEPEKKKEEVKPILEEKIPQNKDSLPKNLEKKEELIVEKKYAQSGVFEIGGMVWGDFKAIKSGTLQQGVWINGFFSAFAADYFLLGLKADVEYYLDPSSYMATGYLVAGATFPVSDTVYMAFSINLGYSYNNTSSSSNLFSYGNEVGVKIELAKHFLLGLGAVYTFHTDFSKDYFNDKVKGLISFSGYF